MTITERHRRRPSIRFIPVSRDRIEAIAAGTGLAIELDPDGTAFLKVGGTVYRAEAICE